MRNTRIDWPFLSGLKHAKISLHSLQPILQKYMESMITPEVVPMIQLNFDKSADGLLPAIVQEYASGQVLMLAYINKLAWQKTLETGKAHYWSRSRNSLWLKGESSGHVQLIREILVDCDDDTVIYQVEQLGGAACHTGHKSCFFRRVQGQNLVIEGERIFDPVKVYGK